MRGVPDSPPLEGSSSRFPGVRIRITLAFNARFKLEGAQPAKIPIG
ncbi:hypothetical protein HNQ58_000997 [Rehaibacterium terrae]|jgi:hypothetical protein|uniref:Uncharacterized protein n=1 Tax=Rehaibacterium terrae TaxID=1341696 RepID=A0A7W7XZ50_9GAMM|nr:hypothetical protein [Rehaibacterium terrae]